MLQILAGVSAVEEGRLQNWISGKCALDAGGIDAAAGLILEVTVAANVIGVGVGVVDGGQLQ